MAYSTISKPGLHFNTVTYTGDNTEYRKIPLDFKADLLWFKRRDATGAHVLSDTVTVITKHLTPNENSTESTSTHLDILSNGVKMRNTGTSYNGSGDTYIYMAFAENPFVTSKGIPTTAR